MLAKWRDSLADEYEVQIILYTMTSYARAINWHKHLFQMFYWKDTNTIIRMLNDHITFPLNHKIHTNIVNALRVL